MQELLVGFIVAFAAWSVVRRYAPKALKRSVRRWTAAMLKRLGLNKAAERLGSNPQGEDCADGCGSCGGCGPAPRKGSEPRNTAAESSITPDALRRTARMGRTARVSPIAHI